MKRDGSIGGFQSRRDCGPKPGVARNELPRGRSGISTNPNGVAPARRNPVGVVYPRKLAPGVGPRRGPTPGFGTESLWDSRWMHRTPAATDARFVERRLQSWVPEGPRSLAGGEAAWPPRPPVPSPPGYCRPEGCGGGTEGSHPDSAGNHRFTAASTPMSFLALVPRPWPGRMVSRGNESGGRTRSRGLAAGSSPATFQADSAKAWGKWPRLRVPSGWGGEA